MDRKSVLFCNMRDELNIEEWIGHYLLQGFDCIIIFDHLSKVPISETLRLYKFYNDRVFVIRELSESMAKMTFMMRALGIARDNAFEWMMYLDSDEYLIFEKDCPYKTVNDMIDYYKDDFDQIAVNWLYFGMNSLQDQEGLTILNQFTKCANKPDTHVKCLVKVSEPTVVGSPHFFYIKDMTRYCNINKTGVNQNWNNNDLDNSFCLVYHYHLQSYESHLRRHCKRDRDDIRGHISDPRNLTFDELNSEYNDRENTYAKDTYSEKIKQFLEEQLEQV